MLQYLIHTVLCTMYGVHLEQIDPTVYLKPASGAMSIHVSFP